MTPTAQRIAIAEAMGFKGCTDTKCDYRKCQHLHKDGKVYFPEPFSTSRYPDYLNDLNAMHEAEKTLVGVQRDNYARKLACLKSDDTSHFTACHATATQRAEEFLRTKGLIKE